MLKKIKAEKLKKEDNVDQNRRKFLKIMFIGSGVLLTGKVLGSLYSWFSSDSSAKNPAKTENEINNDSRGFRIVRNNDGLSIYDTAGEEILQIDKGI